MIDLLLAKTHLENIDMAADIEIIASHKYGIKSYSFSISEF
jgi:hypothetical protein